MKKVLILLCLAFLSLNAQATKDSALYWAIKKNKIEQVKKILKAKPHLLKDFRDGGGGNDDDNIFFTLLKSGDHIEMLEYFITLGVDVHAIDKSGYNALHHLARRKDMPKCFKLLLEKKVSLKLKTSLQFTPLALAIMCGRLENVKALIKAGSDKDELVGERKHTSFRFALHYSKDDIATYLLELGVDPSSDLHMPNTEPAIHSAAFSGCPKALEALIVKAGADLDLTALNSQKNTALWSAVAGRNVDCVKIMLKHGAVVDAGALDWAERGNVNAIIDLLDKHK